MYFKKNFCFIVILSLLITITLSACDMSTEHVQYNAACEKINTIYTNYSKTGTFEENPKLEKSKYGNYVDLILTEISYIKDSDSYYQKYNDSLDALDSIDFSGDLKLIRPTLDKNIKTAEKSLKDYENTDSLIDSYVKKIGSININKNNKTDYIKKFKDNKKNNFIAFDTEYASISKKAIDKYKLILKTIDSFIKKGITKNKASSEIKTLRADVDSIYEDSQAIFDKYNKK